MNPYTGDLVRDIGDIGDAYRSEYLQVPPHLEWSAKLELMGKLKTIVGLESSGQLSRWAKKKREARKKLAIAGK